MSYSSLLALTALVATALGQDCRRIPGDEGWPTQQEWEGLNTTVGGRLIATVPLASVCHDEGDFAAYNSTACANLKEVWDLSQVQYDNASPSSYLVCLNTGALTDQRRSYKSPASVMPGWFQKSCNPFSALSQPCELGTYASYSINVTCAEDIAAGINFSKAHNIRLVIKNKGHDASGKSTGKGGLSLWTNNMKDINIISEYESNSYAGPAIKVGAGVMGLEVYEAAGASGYLVVGGNCPSVGMAGGYAQGGGHSGLSSTYGLAADNVLAWEAVTADGEHVTATPDENAELYWALSGGGGGTYAVVTSMTVRLYEDGPVGGGYLTFDNLTVGTDVFWDAVELFNERLPTLTNNSGITLAYSLASNAFGIYNLVAPGRSSAEVQEVLQPFLEDLEGLGVPYNVSTHESPTYLEQLRRDYSPFPDGPFATSALLSGRLIPKATLLEPSSNAGLTPVLRSALASGEFAALMQSIDVAIGSGSPLAIQPVADNAVLPAWRGAAIQAIITAPWDWTVPRSEMERRQRVLADEITPALDAATPGSGTYLNEANFQQRDWQTEFYGANYPRLLEVKKKYDPESLFYATQAVGSEAWEVDEAGRLCRASA